MIKTALTMNISPQDSQTTSYLANGTHLGLLSSANQNIHVQTCHRPLQLIAAIKADDTDTGSMLAHQRQQISAWQSFLPVLSHRGCLELNSLLLQYHLHPNLVICYDETWFQGWIPAESGLYLLRQSELRRLRPATSRETALSELYGETHHYYALQINPDDYFFILPPELLPYFSAGEAADLLLGLRQLPAKMSDLVHTARQRGYQDEATWLAIQVLRLEEDQKPDSVSFNVGQTIKNWLLRFRTDSGTKVAEESISESTAPADEHTVSGNDSAHQAAYWPPTKANRRFWILIAIVAVLLILLPVWVLLRSPGKDKTGNTLTSSSSSTTSAETTQAPTVTTTAAPTPTESQIILTVSARQLNLRDKPSRDGQLLKTLAAGEQLIQLAEPKDDWVQVKTMDGLTGYVYYKYIQSPETTP
ncbi:MAG: SH3 domain-containing protein [Clostridiaceae bacterium]|nr:SH3 domain-containing protein [Clostridiaceae bacterium]